ncbi:MAG: GNAT family N-acetyltransferase [Rhodoferax sp.]|uniref:GNAT family N-acetyltransferase n=1 Tax=Rhodoferax sp. TaxID=50421 RepID=UPI001B59AD39|nr:GNAT family N-acetyltransferase [Rhodoferax sp.]MBP9905729.1 GNAT family N-acetyltransferase [Rhodoferax sp.]
MRDFPTADAESSASPPTTTESLNLEFHPLKAKGSDVVVPIRSLGENHRGRIADHLRSLNAQDRYYRFGFSANDDQIARYVDGLDFDHDEIFGIYNRKLTLIAMAHVAFSIDMQRHPVAEFGVSVLPKVRARGYGARLFDRAVMHARNRGVQTMFVHALSENAAMLRIARQAGAHIVRDGAESEAHLSLTPATLNTQLAEIVEEHMAQTNYQFKVHAKQFQDTVQRWQAVWSGGASAKNAE